MDKNILRIDNDMYFKASVISLLKKRLSYMHDVHLLHEDAISKIELIYKTKYSTRITLNIDIEPHFIIMFQLILGSDSLKECNTILNHYKYKMEYSNRMFSCKRYKSGKVRTAKITDITYYIKNYIIDEKRVKCYN